MLYGEYPAYIWQRPEWPRFQQDSDRLAKHLARTRHIQGKLLGRMEALGFEMRSEATLRTLTEDVVKTSEIEGEILAPDQVRSSIANRLGLDAGGLPAPDRNVDGVVEMTLDATRNYTAPLTEERLFSWHAALFPTGAAACAVFASANGATTRTGRWKSSQARSAVSVFTIPLRRPSASGTRYPGSWNGSKTHSPWNPCSPPGSPIFGSSPFIPSTTATAVSRGRSPTWRWPGRKRAPSVSTACPLRSAWSATPTTTSLRELKKGSLDITDWQVWFLECLARAIGSARQTLATILTRDSFWEAHAHELLNERQVKILNRLLDGFEEKLTSSKWATVNHCSQDTANRDIRDLIDRGILVRGEAGGRSTNYELVLEKRR